MISNTVRWLVVSATVLAIQLAGAVGAIYVAFQSRGWPMILFLFLGVSVGVVAFFPSICRAALAESHTEPDVPEWLTPANTVIGGLLAVFGAVYYLLTSDWLLEPLHMAIAIAIAVVAAFSVAAQLLKSDSQQVRRKFQGLA